MQRLLKHSSTGHESYLRPIRVPYGSRHRRAMPLARYTCLDVFLQNADVRKVPISLSVVEPVADDEAIRDLEADVADWDFDLAPRGFREQSADLERGRLARPQVAHQVRERQARVDDVLHHEHVPPLERDVEVFEDADDARGVARCAIAGDGH